MNGTNRLTGDPVEPESRPEKAVHSLSSICEAIAKGQFDDVEKLFDIVADETLPSDIRHLAEAFASMVVQIEAREFHAQQLITDLKETHRKLDSAQKQLKRENKDLKKRLVELDVSFDEDQAQEEVREIAESDYFQDLRSRAKTLRSRFKTDN